MTVKELKQALAACNDTDVVRIIVLGSIDTLYIHETERDDKQLLLYGHIED